MDGTLCCETDPGYFDHKLLYYRVMEDPDYKDKASAEEKETAQIIKTYFETGEYPKGLDVKHGKAVATAFKGMTLEEFDNYVKKYRNEQMQGYTNQGEKDGLDYTYTKDDNVITGGEFLVKNLKMNKVSVIEQEIGQKPVLCF